MSFECQTKFLYRAISTSSESLPSRTHDCGSIRADHIGKTVSLSGWVHRYRDHGGLIFIDLRDRYGITQLVFDPDESPSVHAAAEKLRSEWVISIQGKVVHRSAETKNAAIPTGEVEVLVQAMQVHSKAKTPPYSICDMDADVHEDLRLKYRYLDIRRGEVAKNLIMRHKAMMATRLYMDQHGFTEISTPILGKSTPEGSRDYLVPSRIYEGSFYALPQSPQLFKQLLMIAGMDRYFQIAPCFRDEDLRADRQPEFTQIDMEMSFGTPDQLMPLVEGLVQAIFKACLGIDISGPFRKLSYRDCMEQYGTDRPDLRFGMPLRDLCGISRRSSFSVFLEQIDSGGIVKGLCVKGGSDMSRKEIEDYTAFVQRFGIQGLAWMKLQEDGLKSNIVKFFSDELQQELVSVLEMGIGDLVFMIADMPDSANQALDHLRRKIARDRKLIPTDKHEFLWVTDFPLFKWSPEEHKIDSEHHPFTSPHPEDLLLLESAPLKVRSVAYDLVLNGYEIGGGSQRIHNSDLQRQIFDILKLSEEEISARFGFFIEALSYGTPPHLGLALGLDRIMMILCKTDSIRDVVAFPKTQKAADLMMACPSPVSEKQLDELGLKS